VNIKTVNITFHVSDFKEAVSFYENVLALQKKSHWPTYAVFNLCGIMLGLEPEGERGVKEGAPDIYLQVDNVDAVYGELKGKGLDSWQNQKIRLGRTNAKFEDPDGNTFILVQLKK
jgi:predicted enzyme related to lactoylglutathione lyase